MVRKQRIFLLFPLCFAAIFSFSCTRAVSTEKEDEDYYNLTLSPDRVSDFRWALMMGDEVLRCQAGRIRDNDLDKDVLIFHENEDSAGEKLSLDFVLAQQIPLFRTYEHADLSVRIKGAHLEDSWLKVYRLGVGEECIGRDSVRIPSGKGWQKCELRLPLKGTYYLWVAFRIKGKTKLSGSEAWVRMDDIRITLDGKPISLENRSARRKVPELKPADIQVLSWTSDSLTGQIPLLQDKEVRIIGLGESMHGTESLARIETQVIRWLVENRECKLVMVEFPGVLVLLWDLYIQGYPVEMSEIIKKMAGSQKSRLQVAELLTFLKEYNRKTERKVHIAGFERSTGVPSLIPAMQSYFSGMYKQKPDGYISCLLETQFQPDSLLPVLMRPEAAKSLGDFEYKWFKQMYWLTLMEQEIPGVKENGAGNFRDYIMWRLSYYALKAIELKPEECAVFTGHLLHMNKWNGVNSPFPSLGYYLAEAYGSGYRSIALLAGEGTFATFCNRGEKFISGCPLSPPEEGTLEKSALECGRPYFYYPSAPFLHQPVHIRYAPVEVDHKRFKALNLGKRIDGFIFTRDCESIVFPEGQRSLETTIISDL